MKRRRRGRPFGAAHPPESALPGTRDLVPAGPASRNPRIRRAAPRRTRRLVPEKKAAGCRPGRGPGGGLASKLRWRRRSLGRWR